MFHKEVLRKILTGQPKTLFGKAIAQTSRQDQAKGQKEEIQKNRLSWKRKEASQPESNKSVRKPSDETGEIKHSYRLSSSYLIFFHSGSV